MPTCVCPICHPEGCVSPEDTERVEAYLSRWRTVLETGSGG
ncbi:hypothetical protein KIPB_007853, partial [Kipferlia bialata]|eukprot:g7853.t1